MSNKRSKKIRKLMMAMPAPVLAAASEDTLAKYDGVRHRRVSVIRQMKKKITVALDMRVPANRAERARLEREGFDRKEVTP